MKKLHHLFLFIGILFSCQNEDDPDIIINIPKKEYTALIPQHYYKIFFLST